MFKSVRAWFGSLDVWSKLIWSLACVRLVGGILQIFAPITMPHMWRQVDTMATALRFARRWTVESSDLAWWMPAVLNSGDTSGVMPMEFPFLNITGALGFVAAGSNLDLGRSLAQLLALLLTTLLVVVAHRVWRSVDDAPQGMAIACVGASVCSFAVPFSAKFMPDLPAMLFVLIGVAGIWRLRWWGVFAVALGVLMKPTACIVVCLLLLHPKRWKVWGRQLGLLGLAVILPAIWYLQTVPLLKSMVEGKLLFALFDKPDPAKYLFEFWTHLGIWDVFHFHGVFPFGWILVVGAVVYLAKQKRAMFALGLLGIAVLQVSIVGALSGAHARLHVYYLIGATPVVVLLLGYLWREVPFKVFRVILVIGLLARAGEAFVADASGLWDARQGAGWFAECKTLRMSAPDAPWRSGSVWRTPAEEFPLLDLCLGERGQSETGKWGLFRKSQDLPIGCGVIAETERLLLVRCDV